MKNLLDTGQKIRDLLDVESLVGTGAFAEVYRVNHTFLGRQALKIFKAGGMSMERVKDLLGEAILLSRLGHSNIVRVFEADVLQLTDGIHGYFTMELVAAGNLERFWQSHGERFVPVEHVMDIITQSCQGMALAHSESPPIVHRDIKPQNILVGYQSTGLRVRISDFGLAKAVNPLTRMATAVGTAGFLAPESYDSPAGDVWAMGCVLYLLLTDHLPYTSLPDGTWAESADYDRPLVPPSTLNRQADSHIDDMVARSLAVEVRERYSDCVQMLRDLQSWKPRPAKRINSEHTESSMDASKSALGDPLSINEKMAMALLRRAFEQARYVQDLQGSADLLEEAFNHWPPLRNDYESLVKRWRLGVIM